MNSQRNFLVLLLVCIGVCSGIAMTPEDGVAADNKRFDNIKGRLVKEVGDSIANIVLSSKSFEATLTKWENDTFPPKTLTPHMISLVKYTLCQPSMFESDKRVYSAFYSDVQIQIGEGLKYITLELDYNINKWKLSDREGEEICRHDLRNSELLSLMHILWPKSSNLNIKYERLIKNGKE